jgi:hypothetical protein
VKPVENFDGDLLIERAIDAPAEVDHGHAAPAQLFHDFVWTNSSAGRAGGMHRIPYGVELHGGLVEEMAAFGMV